MVLLTALLYCSILSAQKNKFPEVNIDTAKAGDFLISKGYSKRKSKNKEYPKKLITTYATIVVPENREKKDSRLITLPVKKIHSLSKNPKEPIFILFGGPGMSNLRVAPFRWLLADHDIVMVGYRGVDGQVLIEAPSFPETMKTEGSPFSSENLQKMGEAIYTDFKVLKRKGIDIDAYNMIEVINDFEVARNVLGYKKINLFSFSYGTRVAYLYGLIHPESINRSMMEAVNPPDCFVWKPRQIDSIFIDIGEQWKKNPECVVKSPDILKTISTVLDSLPRKWRKITINPDKVKMMMFYMGYTQKGITQLFDAFVVAENGDYSGLAFLCMAYDLLPNMKGMMWGENLAKAVSADFYPEKDYESAMDPEGSIIGSPMSKIFGVAKYGGWKIKSIPEEYRNLRESNVETLMLSGTIDLSTPAQNGTEMLKYLPNGHQVILKNRGHQDIGNLQVKVYIPFVKSFFLTGKVEDSEFKDLPIDFNNVKPTFQKMGKMFYRIKQLRLTGLAMKFM